MKKKMIKIKMKRRIEIQSKRKKSKIKFLKDLEVVNIKIKQLERK